ncbi:MAG: 30S ribosome-binding factor RbfA [Actinomycetota bacterium]
MVKRRQSQGPHDYPRVARLNELIRQIVAEQVELIEDERIDLATVVAVEADPDLRHAVVYVSSVRGEEGDGEVVEALGEQRHRIQSAIGSQARFKRVPELEFRPDEVTRGAARIETILRDLDLDEGDDGDAAEAGEPADGEA